MSSLLSPFHLGPKHVQFYVVITLHELINIPLLSGDFSLSWKVQHAVSHPGRKGASARNHMFLDADERPKLSVSTSREDLGSRSGGNNARPIHSPGSDAESSQRHAEPLSGPGSPGSDASTNVAPHGVLMRRRAGSDASYSAESLPDAPDPTRSPTEPTWHRLRELREGAEPRRSRHRSGSLSGRSAGSIHHAQTEAKGQTPFEKVQQHSVKFHRKVEVMVRVPINKVDKADGEKERDTDSVRSPNPDAPVAGGVLGDTTMHIKVQQQVRTTSGTSTHHQDTLSTLGYVNVNLAEYAPRSTPNNTSSGPTSPISTPPSGSRMESRQYLLEECSCNTMLRISVEMRYLEASPMPYRVPPIRGGILDLVNFMSGDTDAVRLPVGTHEAGEELERRNLEGPSESDSGLLWHYKLPMSLLFHASAVCPEHLDTPEPASVPTPSGIDLMAGDASAPRMTYCDTNTEQLIDDLFQGNFGPPIDERTPDPPTTPPDETQKQRSNLARKRWEKIIHSVGHIAQQADPTRPLRTGSMRSPSYRGEGSIHSQESDVASPLSLHTPRLGELVDLVRHPLSSHDSDKAT